MVFWLVFGPLSLQFGSNLVQKLYFNFELPKGVHKGGYMHIFGAIILLATITVRKFPKCRGSFRFQKQLSRRRLSFDDIKNALGSVTLMMSTFFLSDKFGSLQQIRQGVAKKKRFSVALCPPALQCRFVLTLRAVGSGGGHFALSKVFTLT